MTGYAPRAVSGLRNLAATEREKSLSCSPMKTMLMVLIAICHSDGPPSLWGIVTRAGRDRSAKDGAHATPGNMSS